MAAQPASHRDRNASLVLAVTLSMLMALSLLAAFSDVIPYPALSIFWNTALSMTFLILGLQASRLLTLAGLTLFASVVGACMAPQWLYAILGAGMLAGCVVPGLIVSFRYPHLSVKDDAVTLTTSGRLI